MNFGEMLYRLRLGSRMARDGWNGKGMWIQLVYEGKTYLERNHIAPWRLERSDPTAPAGEKVKVEPYIGMHTAQGTWQPGWLASQADMLADDWHEVLD